MIKCIPFNQNTIASFVVYDATGTQKVTVLGYTLSAAGPQTITWKSAANLLTGAMAMVAGVPISAPMTDRDKPHMICNAGEDLVLTLSAAVVTAGHVTIDVQG